MKITRKISWAFAGLLLLFTFKAFPQGATKYQPTEHQADQLKIKQLEAVNAQQTLQQAQANFQASIVAFNDYARQIEKENNWPATLQVDPQTLAFKDGPAPAPMPAAPPAPAPKVNGNADIKPAPATPPMKAVPAPAITPAEKP